MDWANTENKALREAFAETRDALAESERECAQLRERLNQCARALSETNHRIINGLHLATVFLRLQQTRLSDGAAKDAIRAAGSRIDAMMHVQRQLCGQDVSQSLDFAKFLLSFVEEIGETTGLDCTLRAAPGSVDGQTAVDMSIVVNELLTNAAKHAYGGKGEGRVDIDFYCGTDSVLLLSVRDYGPGFPLNGHDAKPQSLGLTLVRSIVEQRHGTLHIENDGGARFTVTMKPRV